MNEKNDGKLSFDNYFDVAQKTGLKRIWNEKDVKSAKLVIQDLVLNDFMEYFNDPRLEIRIEDNVHNIIRVAGILGIKESEIILSCDNEMDSYKQRGHLAGFMLSLVSIGKKYNVSVDWSKSDDGGFNFFFGEGMVENKANLDNRFNSMNNILHFLLPSENKVNDVKHS